MLRWSGTIAYLIGMLMTSLNIFPANLFFGVAGAAMWTIVGLQWKDRALIAVELASVTIYLFGLVRWAYTVSHQ
jgi:hypothetical protein